MSVELKQLLKDQRIIIEWIAKVILNNKKLSKDNVNYDVTKRLDALNANCEKAQALHSTINYEASEEKRKTLPYFVEDHYLKTEEAFEEAADFLVTTLNKLKKASTSIQEDSSSFEATKSLSSRLPHIIDLPKFSGGYSEREELSQYFGGFGRVRCQDN